MGWSARYLAAGVVALVTATVVIGCSRIPDLPPAPTPSVATVRPVATERPASTADASPAVPTFVADGLGPRSWVASVFNEEDQTHIDIVRDFATDIVLRLPLGERAAAVGNGRIAALHWDLGGDTATTLRVLVASTGVESQRVVIDGLTSGAAVRDDDVLFSVQSPGRDGGVWSIPSGAETPVPLIASGDLPAGSDHEVGGRYLLWTSSSGRTVVADLLRSLDHVSLDVFVGHDAPRRIDLPERANVVGLTDEAALVMNEDFIGAVDLSNGAWLWRIEVAGIHGFVVTPDGRSVVATLIPVNVAAPRPFGLFIIDLATGDSRSLATWAGDERPPTIWPELSTDEVVVVGADGSFGEALLVGDWSATGTAIRLSDGAIAGTFTVTVDPIPVP